MCDFSPGVPLKKVSPEFFILNYVEKSGHRMATNDEMRII